MPRFRLEHPDGTFTDEQAARVDAEGDTLLLQRAHLGVWTTFREIPASSVVKVSRRHTEVNGSWTWSTVWVNPDTPPDDHPTAEADADVE